MPDYDNLAFFGNLYYNVVITPHQLPQVSTAKQEQR